MKIGLGRTGLVAMGTAMLAFVAHYGDATNLLAAVLPKPVTASDSARVVPPEV